MFIDPATLGQDDEGLNRLEEIEKASLRLVTQAMFSFRLDAAHIFARETDKPSGIGEDVAREAMDAVGVSRIPFRLFGTVDYKRARYVFHPAYAIRQALLVDSKAEMDDRSATLQTSQTSMRMRHILAGVAVDIPGGLPTVIPSPDGPLLTTTIVVKFVYEETADGKALRLLRIAGVPNGMLQDRYNTTAQDTIWITGRHAHGPRQEDFRVRLSFRLLREKAAWRVQDIHLHPPQPFHWNE